MRAYDLAIVMLALQLGAGLFIIVLNVGLGGENSLVESIPDAFIFYDRAGSTNIEDTNWKQTINVYESNTYGDTVDDSASAEASSWGNIVRGFKIWNIMKFGIFGIYITIYTLLTLIPGFGISTAIAVAGFFQLMGYFVWSIGTIQYIRGSSFKEYE